MIVETLQGTAKSKHSITLKGVKNVSKISVHWFLLVAFNEVIETMVLLSSLCKHDPKKSIIDVTVKLSETQ